jgi:hypothetical protein
MLRNLTALSSLNITRLGLVRLNIDEDKIKLIIRHYNEVIENKMVNKCHQIREYLTLVNAQETLNAPKSYSSYMTEIS